VEYLGNINPVDLNAHRIFNAETMQRVLDAQQRGTRFSHYTSAEVAFSVLSRKEIWLRRPQLMNDFQEIEWGFSCLRNAWTSDAGKGLQAELDAMFPGSSTRAAEHFDSVQPLIRARTYMTCISEHDPGEDELGRLSMWRAYGGNAGVAIVLNPTVFASTTDALSTYTYPVFYHTPNDVVDRFRHVLERVIDDRLFLVQQGENFVISWLNDLFLNVVLATKHPGFREEREWRVIHTEHYGRSNHLIYEHAVVRGMPQQLVKLPLKNISAEGLTGLDVIELIDRIIIGPNEFAFEIRSVLLDILEDAKVPDALGKVWISDIPVRQPA